MVAMVHQHFGRRSASATPSAASSKPVTQAFYQVRQQRSRRAEQQHIDAAAGLGWRDVDFDDGRPLAAGGRKSPPHALHSGISASDSVPRSVTSWQLAQRVGRSVPCISRTLRLPAS
jgi:hypothetical protein